MKKQMLMALCVSMLIASPLAAQSGSGNGRGRGTGTGAASAAARTSADDDQTSTASSSSQTTSTSKDGKTTTTTTRSDDFWAKWVRTLTNVQIELTLTDQLGTQPAEKKTVSMIASSGNFGKIRSGSTVFPPGEPPYSVVLNVDARPFVSIDGPIQLELTLVYEPVKGDGDTKSRRPSGINQSQTIILQSGKPLIVSQAADPVSDRKVVVEVKATVLK